MATLHILSSFFLAAHTVEAMSASSVPKRLLPRVGQDFPPGAARIPGVGAGACTIRNLTVTSTSDRPEPTGLQWFGAVPWISFPGEVIAMSTNTTDISFENVAFNQPEPRLAGFSTLLSPDPDKKGWKMTVPTQSIDPQRE